MRGPCVFHTNGTMTIKGVVYPPGDPSTAAGMVEAQAFQEAFDTCIAGVSNGDAGATKTEQFTANVRRLHSHINPYNPIIQFLLRSNMDLKVLLSDSNTKGIFYYVLNYATKSEQTLDVLLPLLLPVVERIRNESHEEPAKEVAVRMVRSCLCKQLTSLNIGGPAAASKVFGFPDAKLSHPTVSCPTGPLIAWASSRDRPANDHGENTSDDNRIFREDRDSDGEDSSDEMGVVISATRGKLTMNQRAYRLFLHRCEPSDTEHPLHGMSYFVWHRLVRVVRFKPSGSTTANQACVDSDGSDGEDCLSDTEPAASAPRRRGRPASERYDCVGPYKNKWVQVRKTRNTRKCRTANLLVVPLFLKLARTQRRLDFFTLLNPCPEKFIRRSCVEITTYPRCMLPRTTPSGCAAVPHDGQHNAGFPAF